MKSSVSKFKLMDLAPLVLADGKSHDPFGVEWCFAILIRHRNSEQIRRLKKKPISGHGDEGRESCRPPSQVDEGRASREGR